MDASPSPFLSSSDNHRIKLNVGGTLFETTTNTLSSAPNSILSTATTPIFLDRDPTLFSPLLSLLRSHRLPSSCLRRLSPNHLLRESLFYRLPSSLFSPPPLLPFDASLAHTLSPASSPFISALSVADSDSSLLLAHSGLISSFESSTLIHSSTIRTHLDDVTSIREISADIAAVGSDSAAGIHLYSISTGTHVAECLWLDSSDPRTSKATVTAIDSAEDSLIFASFECWHGENAVLMIDKRTGKVTAEIGRQSGTAARSAAVRKLMWMPEVGLLVGCHVSRGAFGCSGYVRVWDPRAKGAVVWETSEPGGAILGGRMGDPMADVDVDRERGLMAKVGSKSADVAVLDVRKLGHESESDPWVYLEDPNPGAGGSGGGGGGGSYVVHCYKGNVFVGREGGLEAWSRVVDGGEESEWGLWRRNYVDRVEDAERGLVWRVQGGGNRLFVCRENVEGVEVWESSASSSVKMVVP